MITRRGIGPKDDATVEPHARAPSVPTAWVTTT
jgi:hypothetical protein